MSRDSICVGGDKRFPELLKAFNNLNKYYSPVGSDEGMLLGLVRKVI